MAKILIADDEVDLARLWAMALTEEGHAVDVCHDGDTAASFALSTAYDLILTDIFMPGKNGYLVSHLVKLTSDQTKILAVSGQDVDIGDVAVQDEAEKSGATYFLKKPVDIHHLLQTVEQLVRLK